MMRNRLNYSPIHFQRPWTIDSDIKQFLGGFGKYLISIIGDLEFHFVKIPAFIFLKSTAGPGDRFEDIEVTV
jgi:hypothetical protein